MVDTLLLISSGIIILSLLVVLFRFFAGPGLAIRMVAFDVMTVGAIGIIALLTSLFGRFIYLDVAIVYGILSFAGVIVASRFIEKKL